MKDIPSTISLKETEIEQFKANLNYFDLVSEDKAMGTDVHIHKNFENCIVKFVPLT